MIIQQSFDLALRRHRCGRLAEAEALYRQILTVQPNHAEALHFLGVVAHQVGSHDDAVERIRQAIVLNPNNPAAHCNLGEAYRATGRLDEAIAAYRRALELRPNYAEAHNNLGVALRGRGQPGEAMVAHRRALKFKPDYPNAHLDLGNALKDLGQLDKAVAAYRRALELRPDYADAHNNLGVALRELGQLDEAIAAYHHALELKPGFPEAHNNLGNALKERGELDEAIAAYRHALKLKPEDAWVHSNLVFMLHFHPGHDAGTIAEEQQRWNRQFSDPLKRFLQPHANDRSAARRLRVGYVSPDFRDSPVGRYVLPLFGRHDRERFEIFCYSGVLRPDWMTERLRALVEPARNASRSDAGGGWRSTVGVSDARLAEMIREDQVDILVDLALHTGDNRLPVFAREPAPVQVTWLGYPGSAGLPSIGYRLTDARMDPPGEEPALSVEEPVRLPDCWCCYDPIGNSPEINALPALSAGRVTFGSLNNFAKAPEGALALWARVLDAVKDSRLLLRCPEGRARERAWAFFGARGIATERVEMAAFVPGWEYLSLYQRIDLGLDSFPCNGMTVTCDALWMGVPVLTLPGRMPVSRAGLSLLSSVGLGELAASSEEDYVRIAVELAGNLPRLANLRATLRARMKASPLMDAPRFARNVEAAYRSMWERWVISKPS